MTDGPCFISYSTADALYFASKTAPHAGVVKSVFRSFDELLKCDEDGILKDMRKTVEGME